MKKFSDDPFFFNRNFNNTETNVPVRQQVVKERHLVQTELLRSEDSWLNQNFKTALPEQTPPLTYSMPQ